MEQIKRKEVKSMNKSLIITISVLVLLAAGGVGYFTLRGNTASTKQVAVQDIIPAGKDVMPSDKDTMMEEDSMMEENGTPVNKSGSYVQYTDGILATHVENRRVLFFYANWCPICRPADADFNENLNLIPEDVTLIRVNYNDTETDVAEKALAKKYNVTYQHTFVQIDSLGNEITKWNGGKTEELLENIK